MSEVKHTPGPWRYESTSGSNYARIFFSADEEDGDNLRGYCGEANASLIAAAPELLEVAISNAEYRAARDPEFGRGYNAAKNGQRRDVQKESADWYAGYDSSAAIAKATGETE